MLHAFFRWLGAVVQKHARLGAWFAPFGLAFAIVALPGATMSQQLPGNLSLDQIQQLQQQYGNGATSPSPFSNPATTAPSQPPMVLQPAVPPPPASDQAASRMELILSARAGVPVRQFGYDQLGRASAVMVPQTGAVQDDYVLGPGDEIVVVLRGGEVNTENRATVDRNGQVILPRLGPISASGRSFGSFRQDVQAAVSRAYVATEAAVAIARVRQISVLVTGAVNNPGLRLVTGLSSAVDALLLSGGVAKNGSLRDIRVIRGGRQIHLDLYGILVGTNTVSNTRLADGDRIFVAPLGRTVVAAGLVRRAGIYELAPSQKSISARALVDLAGGPEVNGSYFYTLMKLQPDGRTTLMQLPNPDQLVSDGEIVSLQLQADQLTSRVTLSGGTSLAGSYPLVTGAKLSELIRRPGALGTTPYTLFGLISRRDPKTLLRTLTAFTPVAVLNGAEDILLQHDDIVRPISVDEIRLLVSTVHEYDQWRLSQEEAMRNPIGASSTSNSMSNAAGMTGAGMTGGGMTPPGAGMAAPGFGPMPPGAGRGDLSDLGSMGSWDTSVAQKNAAQTLGLRSPDSINVSGQSTAATTASVTSPASMAPNFLSQTRVQGSYELNREVTTLVQLAQQLGVDPLVLINFLTSNQVTLDGALRGPGSYFVGPSVTLQDLVTAAGGTTNWVDASGVELISTIVDPASGSAVTRVTKLALSASSLGTFIVKAHDAFRFHEVFTDVNVGAATVMGEVRFAGNYKLVRGEHLSDLLARSGGLTNSAYPYGTVFLRKSAAALERDGYQRAANEVQNQLVVAMTRVGNSKLDPAAFAAMQSFVTELRNQKPLGRISVSADPSVLAANPGQDPLMEAGDIIYIPQRPSTIAVLGQVMQPGNFPYQPGATVGDYVARAGGYSSLADSGEVFVVQPDGTARKVEKSWLRLASSVSLPPGSAIVVPRDVTPLDLRQTIIDVTQIFSQLAVSIASVAVLAKQ